MGQNKQDHLRYEQLYLVYLFTDYDFILRKLNKNIIQLLFFIYVYTHLGIKEERNIQYFNENTGRILFHIIILYKYQ